MTASNSKLPVVHNGTVGRPPYSDKVRERIFASLKMGCTRTAAYGEAGVSEATFMRWMNDMAGFREDVESAEAYAERMYTGRLARRAAAGSDRAIEFWLSRRRSSGWREKVSLVEAELTLEDVIDEAAEDDKLRSRLEDLAGEALRRGTRTSPEVDPSGESSPGSEGRAS